VRFEPSAADDRSEAMLGGISAERVLELGDRANMRETEADLAKADTEEMHVGIGEAGKGSGPSKVDALRIRARRVREAPAKGDETVADQQRLDDPAAVPGMNSASVQQEPARGCGKSAGSRKEGSSATDGCALREHGTPGKSQERHIM
jgi:hypothetical protein